MTSARRSTLALVAILAALHQDTWNWHDSTLVGGIMPVGLAWHAAFSLVAAAVWGLVVVFAWPGDPLEPEARP